jgi:AcrR family transcriptional regulator
MQRPDEKKRQGIVDAALRLFATRPFHEVRLEDVATAAKVGKGTVYIYFKSKEDLYGSLITEGMAKLVETLRAQLADDSEPAWDVLKRTIREVVRFSVAHPHVYRLMRMGGPEDKTESRLVTDRRELGKLIEGIIRRGVRRGEMSDPHPELTAQFVPACVRASVLYGPRGVSEDVMVNHVIRVLAQGLERRER